MFETTIKKRTFISFILVANIIAILYFGLDFRGKSIENTTSWAKDNSLIFSNQSIALTDKIITKEIAKELNGSGFEIEAVIKPVMLPNISQHILTIQGDEKTEDDLNIFQWGNQLIATNGNDYDYRLRIPRVFTTIKEEKQFIKLRGFPQKLQLYVNNTLVSESISTQNKIPSLKEGAKIKLGNYNSWQNGWNGSIYTLSLTPLKPNTSPLFKYTFHQTNNEIIRDISGFGHDLHIPKNPIFYDRVLLKKEVYIYSAGQNILLDIIKNILGFIPLGFILMVYFQKSGKRSVFNLYLAIAIGFALSLFIEYTQSWLPMRDSNMRDLFLNTIGTAIGVACFFVAKKMRTMFTIIKN